MEEATVRVAGTVVLLILTNWNVTVIFEIQFPTAVLYINFN